MNIVSIDFDIIMKPSIEFYNNSVHSKNGDNLYKDSPYTNCQADLIIY